MSAVVTHHRAPLWVHWFAAFLFGVTLTAFGFSHQQAHTHQPDGKQQAKSLAAWSKHYSDRVREIFYSTQCHQLLSNMQRLEPQNELQVYSQQLERNQVLSTEAQSILNRFWAGDMSSMDDLDAAIALHGRTMQSDEIEYILTVVRATLMAPTGEGDTTGE